MVLDGEESGSVPVTSGVSQIYVLGQILILIYINTLPDKLVSKVRLYADDAAVYLTIRGEDMDRRPGQTLCVGVPMGHGI